MADINSYMCQTYFAQIYQGHRQKMWSKSLTLAITIAEMENRTTDLKKLYWIYDNTTESMGISLPILEDLYEKSYNRSKMKTYSLYGKEIPLHLIIKALSDAYIQITIIVTKIAKDMNVELDFDFSRYNIPTE